VSAKQRDQSLVPNLHIVQGGIDNGDKARIVSFAASKKSFQTWVVPKNVAIGDDVVIYIAGYGFYAIATISSTAAPRPDWPGRYGAGLRDVRLISPAISLATIKRRIPDLAWANYPRSITTPTHEIADRIRALISERRRTGIPDLDDAALSEANIDELRKVALLRAKRSATKKERKVIHRARSRAIHLYVLCRASGTCEGCGEVAPFRKTDGSPYLEPHHTTRLADDGPDHPANVIALCPTCHRRAHHSEDAKEFNASLIRRLRRLERQ
jgi:5-methylcytosine-specific restriction endonuclease McrA